MTTIFVHIHYDLPYGYLENSIVFACCPMKIADVNFNCMSIGDLSKSH